MFANLATLDDLPAHAELAAGAWPVPGSNPLQVTLPEKVAAQLSLEVGERVPLYDRGAERAGTVVVVGTWRPRDAAEAYWRLAPGVGESQGDAEITSYGPFALDPADFARTFPGSTSAAWVVDPDLVAVEPARLPAVTTALDEITGKLPEATGLGSSTQQVSHLDRLVDRLSRADLVGRSALLTPLLLIVVLGGYALVLVAALLNEDRRAQTALLRARGAARGQIAGLAVREATLVVAPALLLAPALTGQAIHYLGADLGLADGDLARVWVVAVGAAVGCLLAMVLPAMRRAGTYVADMAARSRPSRGAAVQRASVDIALVALAVLAWTQLRQYSSPLAGANGSLGIDPLLAAAPTIGVLAGAVIALRLLPPTTRIAERFVDRRTWNATMFGMWQAGRRPHAGPVLLLALAVGGSTLAWSLVASWERSQRDQAQHTVGADLRLTERDGTAPADRSAELAAVPGVDRVLPAWRDDVRLGREAGRRLWWRSTPPPAKGMIRLDDAGGDASTGALLDRLANGRTAPAGGVVPEGAKTLSGTVRTPVESMFDRPLVAVTALFTTDAGATWRVRLAEAGGDGKPVRFSVPLPDSGGAPLRLAGFEADGGDATGSSYRAAPRASCGSPTRRGGPAGAGGGAVAGDRPGVRAARHRQGEPDPDRRDTGLRRARRVAAVRPGALVPVRAGAAGAGPSGAGARHPRRGRRDERQDRRHGQAVGRRGDGRGHCGRPGRRGARHRGATGCCWTCPPPPRSSSNAAAASGRWPSGGWAPRPAGTPQPLTRSPRPAARCCWTGGRWPRRPPRTRTGRARAPGCWPPRSARCCSPWSAWRSTCGPPPGAG
nr:FtsX-like permease family protein [Micromonospora provocatoris]